ncbi:hypothetical protein [Parerythrobacter jejuensis]|uniref:Uncharacterized protein n=1 Tax=Parerythrobacter jejuensis TaxID=795812 RepID=A0A845AVE0_9SPHN|nr:hypothetical protein [Parerythrobacter jejuensis]MXP32456.1 hypothetical protein [Parerythrobacter jejuensis]
MIEALVLLFQPTASPLPAQRLSDHIASVHYDCAIVDEAGHKLPLEIVKRGRMTVVGEYEGLWKTTTDVPFVEPEFRVLEKSDRRFERMLSFEAKPRRIAGQEYVRSLDSQGDFAALFQMTRHQLSSGIDPETGRLSGLSIVLYMPRQQASDQTETLGGVCVASRLEDKQK